MRGSTRTCQAINVSDECVMRAPRMANVGRSARAHQGGALLELWLVHCLGCLARHFTGLTPRSLCTIEQWAPTQIAQLDSTVDLPTPLHERGRPGWGQQIGLVAELAAQLRMAPTPRLEAQLSRE